MERESGVLDGWLGGWLVRCCSVFRLSVSGTIVTLVDVVGVVGSGGGWFDVADVVMVEELVAEVVVVGTGSSTYLTLEPRFLRTSFG